MSRAHEDCLTRRGLITRTAAGLSLIALPSCASANRAGAPPPRPIGIQLYTVRAEMNQDPAGTLRRLAEIGYTEVERADITYPQVDRASIARMIEDAGLTAPAAHVPAVAIRDEPETVLEQSLRDGLDYVVFPWLAADDRSTLDQWRGWADALNSFGERCRSAGLQLAYHNHDFEFEPIDGVEPYDLLLERCDAGLVRFELDFYWARAGGRDALTLLAAHPGRFPLCHVKDMDTSGAFADVGDGVIDYESIFAQAETAQIAHLFIEHDRPTDALMTSRRSFDALSNMLVAAS